MGKGNLSDLELDSSFLDSLLAHIAIVDNEGIIKDANKAWKDFGSNRGEIKRANIGTNYFNVLQQAVEYGNDYALKFILGLKKVINQDKDTFSLTYPLQTSSNLSWFKLTARPCNDERSRFIMINEDVTATVEMERRWKETQNRYQVQFEQSLDGILITDTKGNIIDANPAAGKMLGWDRENLIARTRDEIIDVQDQNYQEALRQRKKTGSYRIETELIHKEGHKIPAEVSSKSYRNKSGKLRAIVNIKDISQRKKTEGDLIKNKHFTESALNSVPGVFLVLNRKGNIVRWNEQMTADLGYSAEELSGKNALEFIVDAQIDRVREKLQECFVKEDDLSVETRVIARNGEIKDYFLFAKHFIEDGKSYLVGTGIDITEQKEVERENKKTQLKLQQLFDNAPVGIVIADDENNIQQVNKSFEEIFSYSREEVINKNINDLIVPGSKTSEADAITASTLKGKPMQTKSIRLSKDNREVPVLIGGVPVKYEGETISIYGIYVDISEQQQYQDKIEEALKEKETLLAELHHRVKNNLALIISLLELQLFDSENPQLNKELTSVKNRILTIASIHEVLYQNGNLNKIPFSNFLGQLFDTETIRAEAETKNIDLNTDENDVLLSINQSIPSGLLLNELLALVFEFSSNDERKDLFIRLREYNHQVHIIVEGNNLLHCPKEVKENHTLHNELIDILVRQLDGTLIWPSPGSQYQKFELVFTKQNGNGPAQKMLEKAE